MKTKLLFLICTSLCLSNMYGQLLFHEPFAYNEGLNLIGQPVSGLTWTNSGTSSVDEVMVLEPWSSSYGLPATSGNALYYQGGNSDPRLTFASQTSGVIYYSLLMSFGAYNSSVSAPGEAWRQVHLSNAVGNVGASVYAKSDDGGATIVVGYSPSDVASETVWNNVAFALDEQHLIVVSYNLTTQEGKMWIDPVVTGNEPTTGFLTTGGGSKPRTDLEAFNIQQSSNNRNPGTIIDEIRVAKTWVEVTGGTLSTPSNELASKINFYPNPAKNTLSFNSNDLAIDSILFYTVEGKEVLNIKNFTNNTLDISSLSKGIYSVRVTTQEGVLNKKIIVK